MSHTACSFPSYYHILCDRITATHRCCLLSVSAQPLSHFSCLHKGRHFHHNILTLACLASLNSLLKSRKCAKIIAQNLFTFTCSV